ncbi:MAG: 3-oxoacyl-ACP reductase [Gammaproteobacteria bacterium]|nr:MAG: 3-oxoacyl-ACP reductase [Gammaproteobacteria bacterium]
MTTEFADERVLVTGASRGIGAAIADAFAAAGATVTGTATSEKGAAAITERFAAAGVHGEGRVLDVCDVDSINTFWSDMENAVGAPTVLVNNAGITRDNLFMRMKDDEWDDVIATNLSSIYRLCRLAVKPMMKARGGRIINITSVVGLTGNAGQVNYAASKAGILGLTKSLARELGARNITVNAVAPGFIESDMTSALSDEQRAALAKEIALGCLGRSEDIAAACLYLASPGARYVTGQTLNVNGGMYMP